MDGKKQHQSLKNDYSDPFNAGQLVGMLVMLTFIEKNQGVPEQVLRQLRIATADNLQEYFDKPSEDIHLMINNIVKDMK